MNDPRNVPENPTEPSSFQSVEGRGYVGQDCFGRVFFDACESEEQHLVNPNMKPSAERPGCRIYLDDAVPKNLIGKHAYVTVHIRYTPLESK